MDGTFLANIVVSICHAIQNASRALSLSKTTHPGSLTILERPTASSAQQMKSTIVMETTSFRFIGSEHHGDQRNVALPSMLVQGSRRRSPRGTRQPQRPKAQGVERNTLRPEILLGGGKNLPSFKSLRKKTGYMSM